MIDNGSNYRAGTMAAIPAVQEWADLACPVDRREQDSQSARCSSAHTTTYCGPSGPPGVMPVLAREIRH